MADFAKEELTNAEEKKNKLESELEVLLIPHDPNDEKNVIVEIRGAAGGDEANILLVICLICIVNMLLMRDGK